MNIRTGECRRCGRCCQSEFLLKGLPLIARLCLNLIAFLRYRKIVRKKDKCAFLKFENGKATCTNYKKRPEFCRAYPVTKGDLVDGCGFKIWN